jgi:hypothetical protein
VHKIVFISTEKFRFACRRGLSFRGLTVLAPPNENRTSVTEIPEHLLKRSRERRSALGLGGDDTGAGSDGGDAPSSTPAVIGDTAVVPAAATPATRAAAPEPAAPPPPKPVSVVVAAHNARRRIPFWAMVALSLLPIWAFMYARAVTTQTVEATGPVGLGAELYGSCASCHGATGDGLNGYAFTDGEVLATFPNIEDQLRFVYFGTESYNIAGIEIYGDPNRDGGAHITGARGPMPAWGAAAGGELTDYDILGVVCHERYELGGADETGAYAEEYEAWCSEESVIFEDLSAGGLLADLDQRFPGVLPIGDAPAPGSSALGE